jgi:hypothetical protein
MKKLEKLKKFEVTNISSIWGGADCVQWTSHTDYTYNSSGGCSADETCWVCDKSSAPATVAGGVGTGGAI